MTLTLGLISGTSCDGVDIALADCSDPIQVIQTGFEPYPKDLQSDLHQLIESQQIALADYAALDMRLGVFFAEVVQRFLKQHAITPSDVLAIGSHGQTVFHQPEGRLSNTIQLGAPHRLAAETGIPVVAQFRQLDVAYGGQGAPLAPAIHRVLFYQKEPVAVINLGGIANISGFTEDHTYGYDTGPASCLMDGWAQKHLGKVYDADGAWAASGELIPDLLEQMLNAPYFKQPTPKSTGRELFNQLWLQQHLEGKSYAAVDVQCTLAQLTAQSVIDGLQWLSYQPSKLIICGGGAHNTYLIKRMQLLFAGDIISSTELGYDSDNIEALLMAYLAHAYMCWEQIDLSTVTGAPKALKYGVLFTPE